MGFQIESQTTKACIIYLLRVAFNPYPANVENMVSS